MTVAQINKYLDEIDGASNRVITADAANSVDGQTIHYAIVGTPDRVTPEGLAAIQANLELLRNPQADPGNAVEVTPAILWVSGNVHGGEESGTDASLHALYELAARSDCVVDEILANSLVVILPTQNPDGREIGQRRNQYGFDMNRDWFARTQPETDGKLEVVRAYPPMLYIDAHEFGLSNYFFPPNADPEYHEIPDTAHDWINQLYSPAIAAEFDRQGIKYFHGAPYDFFAIVFGDTVPTEGFHAAGMTFEKESGDPISEREHEQFTSIWASLFAGATARADVVAGWRASWAEAYQQGLAGSLEENNVFEPRHDLYQEVPDSMVRGYFLAPDPERAFELQLLVRRLQRMDVEVRRLTASTAVDDFHPYGDGTSGGALLATGTYWIPLAQAQKHWIQAMLHEDSWIPFDVTYDVTAWSNPLLMNLEGGWSGADVDAPYEVVAPMGEPEWPLPADLPAVGLLENDRSTRGFEAAGQTRYLFTEVWQLPHTDLTYDDIGADPMVLDDFDVLVMPDGYAGYALQDLGAKGKKALREWVNARRANRCLAGRRRGGDESRGIHREVRHIPHEHARSTRPRRARPRLAAVRGHRRPELGDVPGRPDDAARPRGRRGDVPAGHRSGLRHVRASRSAWRHSQGPRPSSTRRWAAVASSRSRSTRTSEPGPRAPSACCGTPSSGMIRPASGRLPQPVRGCVPPPRKPPRMPPRHSPTSGRPSGSGSPGQTPRLPRRSSIATGRRSPGSISAPTRCSSSPTGRTCRTTSTRSSGWWCATWSGRGSGSEPPACPDAFALGAPRGWSPGRSDVGTDPQ